MENKDLKRILQELLENEARSCSMDFGGVTPLYAYRMLGGKYPLDVIEKELEAVKNAAFSR